MAKKILITGINGFMGRHLADYILRTQKDAVVYGGDNLLKSKIQNPNVKSNPKSKTQNLKPKIFQCDVRNYRQINNLINKIKPDIVFHLAAKISVPESWEKPQEYFGTNVIGTINLLESVRKYAPKTTIFIPGSSEIYGNPKSPPKFFYEKLRRASKIQNSKLKIDENWPLFPQSPYALTKMCQEILGRQYWEKYGLKVVLVRTFNITGPGQSDLAVCSQFAKAIADIESNKRKPLMKVGNLNIVRDFTDVWDVARAYWLAIQKCKSGEIYNICGSQGYRIGDILNKLLSFSTRKIKIKKDSKLFRKSEPPVLIGDSSKFRKATGWKPKIDILNKTIPEMLKWHRAQIPADQQRRSHADLTK